MSARGEAGGSRFLYAPFDAANARIEANERVAEERWQALEFRLNAIETALERLERRLWLAVFGVVSVVLAQAIKEIVQMSSAG
ncbi:hypothetical protein DZD18_08475 [Rhodobacteraceae bacterium W635]|uniref:GTA head formation protein, RCAP_rcc01685 family n=1 Tax=Nioella halotolerans TaxID=2303578 RepID=UPI000E3D7234|nr:hypothetical protein DZD18_08475 [Rhodobacteraceae bacterium W635]